MGEAYRILMVDDDTRYHRVYELAITEALPSTVVFATNGQEALSKLAAAVPFDLVILDLNMPKLGGEETLKRVRADASLDGLPVIILTGDTDQETHRRLLDIGADDFVEKGAPPEIFVARLATQLRHKVAMDRLTRAAIDRDLFAAGVLHDIRNLEANILAVCELTRSYLADNPEGRRDTMRKDFTALSGKAESVGAYAAAIIGMVRDTNHAMELRSVDLLPQCRWAADLAATRGDRTEGDGVARPLQLDITGTLAPVMADEHFLQLALLNICQNAIKYRRRDAAPRLIVSQRPGTGSEAGLVVSRFADNGIGVPKADLSRIFEPFKRGRTPSRQGGFGLGLALVHKVVTAMGGRAWAELPPDGSPGTILCLALPADPTHGRPL